MSLDQPQSFVKHQSVTRDAFLGGRLHLSQPQHGFRAGLDSVLLGAAVRGGSRTLLDLGSGVGTASFVAMAHNAVLHATLAEQNQAMAGLAEDNALANGVAARARVVRVDVTAKGSIRKQAGLSDNGYDSVIANPPFFSEGTRAGEGSRADARHMDMAALDLWIKAAASSAAGGGEVIFIYPASSLGPLLAGFEQRFGAITVLPLAPRRDVPASRVLIRGIKGSRAPLTLLHTRILHGEGRAFAADFDAIFRGEAVLGW